MLRSPLRPAMNNSAVEPLMTTPTAATMTTIMPESGSGDWRRRIASQAIPPVMTSSRTALASATRMVLPRNP